MKSFFKKKELSVLFDFVWIGIRLGTRVQVARARHGDRHWGDAGRGGGSRRGWMVKIRLDLISLFFLESSLFISISFKFHSVSFGFIQLFAMTTKAEIRLYDVTATTKNAK